MALNPVYVPMTAVTESRLIGNVVLVAITLFVVALRILTRLVTGSKLGWDDYFTLMCVPQGIGLLICQGLCKCVLAISLYAYTYIYDAGA